MSATDDATSHPLPTPSDPAPRSARDLAEPFLLGAVAGMAPAVAAALALAPLREHVVELLALAAMAGGLVTIGLEILASRWGSRPGGAGASDHAGSQLEPIPDEGWLHLVCGTDRRRAARGALELAAPMLARGRRALIVEGSARHRVHEWFGREQRWGMMECLCAGMPVLGLVQYAGRPGLYLLAHGNPARRGGWERLGQLLDEARPHFGRVILVLDGSGPRAIEDALSSRGGSPWWVGGSRKSARGSRGFAERIGKPLSTLDLSAMSEATLEALDARVGPLVRSLAPVPMAPEPTAPEPLQTIPEPAPVPVEILDCDLQVRERLRFLLWMRSVQTEGARPSPAAEEEQELVSAR